MDWLIAAVVWVLIVLFVWLIQREPRRPGGHQVPPRRNPTPLSAETPPQPMPDYPPPRSDADRADGPDNAPYVRPR